MTERVNHLGQPIGFALPDWQARQRPPRTPILGRFCRAEPLDPDRHAAALFEANRQDKDGRNWTYLAYGPYDRFEDYRLWVEQVCRAEDPFFHAIIVDGRAVGVASLMRMEPAVGVIEVGHINYSPLLQRKPAATEPTVVLSWIIDITTRSSRRSSAALS